VSIATRLVGGFQNSWAFPLHDETVVNGVRTTRVAKCDLFVWNKLDGQILCKCEKVLFD
jgi:hypothetical protein